MHFLCHHNRISAIVTLLQVSALYEILSLSSKNDFITRVAFTTCVYMALCLLLKLRVCPFYYCNTSRTPTHNCMQNTYTLFSRENLSGGSVTVALPTHDHFR